MPTRLTAAIVHPRLDRVLARRSGDGWELPLAELPARHWHADHGPLATALARTLGLSAEVAAPTLLRRLVEADEGPEGLRELAMLAELPPPGDLAPPGWTWLDAQAAAGISEPWARAAAAKAFASLRADVPAIRPPWARERSGWHAAFGSWVDEALAAEGLQRVAVMEPVKIWNLSAVYRVATNGGVVYAKAATPSQPLFVDEAQVTVALAELFPAHLPRVLAARPGLCWLLLADAGEPIREQRDLSPEARRSLAIAAARTHARLQVASTTHVDELLAAGCVDRRLPQLASQVGPLLDDPLTAEYIKPELLARLRAAKPKLLAAVEQLAALKLPPALVHGDLHLGNTLLRDGEPIFIDWTDACIAPAMVDLIAPLWTDDPELATAWLDAYFEVWSAVVSRAVLDAARQLNDFVLPLHHALSYRSILAHVEPLERGDQAGALVEFLTTLAERLG